MKATNLQYLITAVVRLASVSLAMRPGIVVADPQQSDLK